MTLNTFHFAGVGSKSEVVRGVPRLKEIISVSKNIKSPMLTVFLKEEYGTNKEMAATILNNLEITTLKDLTISSSIYYDPPGDESLTTILEDRDLLNMYKEFSEFGFHSYDTKKEEINPWLLRLEFDREKMVDKQINMVDIYYAIYSRFNKDGKDKDDMICVFSDDNASNLVFRIQCLVDKDDNDDCDEEDMICLLKTVEETILNDIVLKGVKGINKASMNKEENLLTKVDNEFVKMPQWVIDTNGSNLLDVLNHPQVDFTRTFSNNINEIYEVLGIEAAREAIINEITDLLSFDGTYINFRHISLLADVMTNRGSLMSIDRHGINKSDRGPLAKCSFEETPDIISKAAIFGEYDKITGVSANIMLGQPVMSGTGFSEILFDEKIYTEKYETMKVCEDDQEATDEIVNSLGGVEDDYCAQDNFGFNFDMQHLNAETMAEELPSVNISLKTEKTD
jgi:DNA-directed RNA polymerase II subunit RPB1